MSYLFGFNGPSLVVETACSSSLVALSMAHHSLILGATQAAVNGGVNLMMHPSTMSNYAAAGGDMMQCMCTRDCV